LPVAAGCGGGFEARPPESRALVSDDDLARFEEHGVTIHPGLTPPDVSGTYLHDSVGIVDVSGPAGADRQFCNLRETLARYRGDRMMVRDVASIGPGCNGFTHIDGVSMSGSDHCFTLYFRDEATAAGCTSHAVRVISGCVGANGLTDYREGWFDDLQEGAGCAKLIECGLLPPVGSVSVIEERDGLVAKVPSH